MNRRPLLVFLHGLGASGRVSFDAANLERLGANHQIYVVAPDGSVDGSGRRYWNAHPACCDFEGRRVNHVDYLSRLLSEFEREHYVDSERIFVMGFSNGGFMAHRLACELGNRLAGIVSAAGAGPNGDVECRLGRRMRILEIHGDADETVRYAGGALFGRPNSSYGSARDTFASWAKRFECKGAPTPGEPLDLLPNAQGKETKVIAHEGCPRGAVALWTVRGGTHYLSHHDRIAEKAWLYLNRGI